MIPVIAANNISIIDQTHGNFKNIRLLYPELVTWTSAKLATFHADAYVIPTFFFPKVISNKVKLTHPVVRNSVAKTIPTEGNHVLVYYTSSTRTDFLEELKNVNEQFKVYGFEKKEQDENMQFCEFSEEQFINDLASAKAVITGGGFSLISESIFLKKPIFSIPLENHFEQIFNAQMLEEKGFGKMSLHPQAKDIELFLQELPAYRNKLAGYSFDHTEFVRKVDSLAVKVAVKPDQTILNRLYETVRRRAIHKIKQSL